MEWEGKEEQLLNACYEPGTMNRKQLIWVFLHKSPKEKDSALFKRVHSRPPPRLNLGQPELHRKWVPRAMCSHHPSYGCMCQEAQSSSVAAFSWVTQLCCTAASQACATCSYLECTWNVPGMWQRAELIWKAHTLSGVCSRTALCWETSVGESPSTLPMPLVTNYQEMGVGEERCIWASFPSDFHLNYRSS